jgi:tetratricopeptide (TPR) repeat protein
MTRQMELPRFEAETLAFRGDFYRVAGRHAEALADLEEAVAFFRRSGTEYFGPSAIGFLAQAARDDETRRSALAEGEALLATNAVAHNHLNFRQHAIDACLEAGRWDEARRHAAALEDFVRHEPFPWSTFFVARGRALADHGEGRRDAELISELERLREEGTSHGYLVALPAIEAALSA